MQQSEGVDRERELLAYIQAEKRRAELVAKYPGDLIKHLDRLDQMLEKSKALSAKEASRAASLEKACNLVLRERNALSAELERIVEQYPNHDLSPTFKEIAHQLSLERTLLEKQVDNEELEASKQHILDNFGVFGRIGCTLGFSTELEAKTAIDTAFPSITLEMFMPEDNQGIAILKLTDASIVDSLLRQTWFKKLDRTNLSLGTAKDVSKKGKFDVQEAVPNQPAAQVDADIVAKETTVATPQPLVPEEPRIKGLGITRGAVYEQQLEVERCNARYHPEQCGFVLPNQSRYYRK